MAGGKGKRRAMKAMKNAIETTHKFNLVEKGTLRRCGSFELPDAVVQRLTRLGEKDGLTFEEVLTNAIRELVWKDSLFTLEGGAIADRLVRDHAITKEAIIAVATHDLLLEMEEDVALDGSNDGGDLEQYFVADARRVMKGKPLPTRPELKGHKIGSKSYVDMMKAVDKREQRRLLREAQEGGIKTRP
jgi:hypothetical protein